METSVRRRLQLLLMFSALLIALNVLVTLHGFYQPVRTECGYSEYGIPGDFYSPGPGWQLPADIGKALFLKQHEVVGPDRHDRGKWQQVFLGPLE